MESPKLDLQRENRAGSDAKLGYFDRYKGRYLRFEPSRTLVTVTARSRDAEAIREVAQETKSETRMLSPERGAGVLKVRATEDAVGELLDHAEVANAIPVLVDPEGNPRRFLPDELVVQFQPHVTDDEAQQVIQEQGSWV